MFSKLSTKEFIQRYWQQKPLVLEKQFTDMAGVVDGNDLAGLACEEIVESRIICGSGLEGPWSCEQGPFEGFDYDSLGANDWTLLVQGLDQWDATVRSLLERFSFLPTWRLEDVMASFAPVGGGVGPHFDYYDVFLIQVGGRRRWQLGDFCDETTPLQNPSQVKLLETFNEKSVYELDVGDALYVPAGLSHWGTSLSDDCVTLSVGFRAPSDQEILAEAVEIILPKLSDAMRYQDRQKSIDADRFKINETASDYARKLLARLDPNVLDDALAEALGRLVTDTRYCSFNEQVTQWSAKSIQEHVAESPSLRVARQPHCRMAYSQRYLFVNGEAYEACETFSRRLCQGELDAAKSDSDWKIVAALLNEDMLQLV